MLELAAKYIIKKTAKDGLEAARLLNQNTPGRRTAKGSTKKQRKAQRNARKASR